MFHTEKRPDTSVSRRMASASMNTDGSPVPSEDKRYTTREVGGMTPGPTLVSQLKVDTIRSTPDLEISTPERSGMEGNLVEVVWFDSTFTGGTGTGFTREELQNKTPLRTRTWGELVVDDPDFLVVAQSHNDEGYFEVLTIPIGMVEAIYTLGKLSDVRRDGE